MKNKQYDFLFKFVMVGNSAVGKSSLLLRFADDQFNENYMITIGVDFRFKSMKVNDKVIKLQIWDTAGQERFRTIVNTYYKSTLLINQDSNAVFMIFDLGVKQSFNDIKSYWINQVESYTDQGALLVLVGNKADGTRAVLQQEISSFVKEKNLEYFETSAKNGNNVKAMFQRIAGQLSQRGHKQKVGASSINTPTTKLTSENAKKQGAGYSCQC